MDISQITSTSPSTASGASSSAAITSDFETFLRMLTVQLENQDPLNPVDSADYAVQLATFSNVEQQVQTNDLLRSLTTQLQSSGLAEMAGWVGMSARVQAPVQYQGDPIDVIYPAAVPGSDQAALIVKDSSGFVVARFDADLAGGEFAWDGTGTSGQPLPVGRYSFDLESLGGDELLNTDPADAFGQVLEVRQSNQGVTAVLAGGSEVLATNVVALR